MYNYKFGSKELQETGFYDFGARILMTDLGRWATVDPSSEANFSENPYNYVLGNPINLIDPDGRLQKEHYQKPEGSEGFFSSGGGGFADYFSGGGSGFSSSINSYLGNTGSGWGTGFGSSSKTFWQTGAYASIMSAYNAGGTASLTNTNGFMKWWIDIPNSSDAEGNLVKGVGEFHISKFMNDSNESISNRIDRFMTTHFYAEASGSLKHGTFVDIGLKNGARLSLGAYTEDSFTLNGGIKTNNTNKYAIGGAYILGATYTYDVYQETSQVSLGVATFGADITKNNIFVGWNPNISVGLGIGVEGSFKIGFNFKTNGWLNYNNWFK